MNSFLDINWSNKEQIINNFKYLDELQKYYINAIPNDQYFEHLGLFIMSNRLMDIKGIKYKTNTIICNILSPHPTRDGVLRHLARPCENNWFCPRCVALLRKKILKKYISLWQNTNLDFYHLYFSNPSIKYPNLITDQSNLSLFGTLNEIKNIITKISRAKKSNILGSLYCEHFQIDCLLSNTINPHLHYILACPKGSTPVLPSFNVSYGIKHISSSAYFINLLKYLAQLVNITESYSTQWSASDSFKINKNVQHIFETLPHLVHHRKRYSSCGIFNPKENICLTN